MLAKIWLFSNLPAGRPVLKNWICKPKSALSRFLTWRSAASQTSSKSPPWGVSAMDFASIPQLIKLIILYSGCGPSYPALSNPKPALIHASKKGRIFFLLNNTCKLQKQQWETTVCAAGCTSQLYCHANTRCCAFSIASTSTKQAELNCCCTTRMRTPAPCSLTAAEKKIQYILIVLC